MVPPNGDGSGTRKASFAPVWDARTRVLVLGSLPGEISLARGQYYANPQNQFWRLIGEVVGQELVALDYESRLEVLKAMGVGLWDVIATAERAGSLDGAIRGHEANALPELALRLPKLAAIAFNGKTSARIGRPVLAGRGAWDLVDLPSSSPAFTRAYELKRQAWMTLKACLSPSTR
jgi:hypoxanthine-DNA glycosylase